MALLVKQLVTRFATMYRPALASGRFLSIKGVRDCDRGFESSGFYGSCDVRGLTTRCSYAVATCRFFNISGVRDCDRGFGFNAYHDVRGFTTKIYNGSGAKSFSERFINRFQVTRFMRLAFRYAMTFEDKKLDLKKTHIICPDRLEEDPNCLKVYIHMPTPGQEDVKISFEHDTVFVESVYGGQTFFSFFELPDIASTKKIYMASDITAVLEVESGWITLTIPKLKEEEMVYDVHVVLVGKDDQAIRDHKISI